MLSVQIDNPQLERFFHHSSAEVLKFLEENVGALEEQTSMVVSSFEEARRRVVESEQSDDLTEQEYKDEMKKFFSEELHIS